MKSIIFFDLDGTISDPKIGITQAVQYALQSFGIHIDNTDDLCKFIGPPLWNSFKDFYGFNEAQTKKAVEKYREYYTTQGLYENTLYDGMDAMLKKLKDQGKTLIIATSKPTVTAQRVLEYFNLRQYFTFVSGSELNGERSDKKEIIQYAIEKNSIKNLSDCIMVGDRKHDIIGANGAGIDSIGVLYGYGNFDELTEAGAKFIVKNIAELSKLLCKY